jgi:hypothetical protein
MRDRRIRPPVLDVFLNSLLTHTHVQFWITRISLLLKGCCPGALILWFVLGVVQMPNVMAEDYGRNGGAQGGKVRAGCKALADSAGREVSADRHLGSPVSRAANCPGATVAGPEDAPVQKAAERVTPDPSAGPIDVDESQSNRGAGRLSLKVEPIGVGLAITSGGVLFWILRSGLWASFLVMGLPLWRDLDLLPIVARGGDDPPVWNDAPEVAGEEVFSSKAPEPRAEKTPT